MTGPATPVVLPAATVQWHAPLHHEETLGRSQVSSHPLGGPGAARDGGAHNDTVTDLIHWWQALGGPLLAELQGAAQQASPALASARARNRPPGGVVAAR